MKQKMILLFLLLSLLAPLHMTAADNFLNDLDLYLLDQQLDHSLVFIDKYARRSIVDLQDLLPNHQWSLESKMLCEDIEDAGTVALYQQVDHVISECLEACNNLPQNQLRSMQEDLENYQDMLRTGQAHLNVLDKTITRGCCEKPKAFCKLCVRCLRVSGALVVNGPLSVNGSFILNGFNLTAALGTIGASGTAAVGLAGYGYIYALIPQTVAVEAPVLFDSNGPLLGVTHTPGSNAIGIVSAGTYAVIFSVSGTEPNQFAIFVNGAPAPSTVYGSGAGTQQNTGLSILTLAAGDVLTLVNHSSAAAVTLASVVGGTEPNVSASVLIERLA